MINNPASRRRILLAPVILAIVALAMALATPRQALAREVIGGCKPTSAKRKTHACDVARRRVHSKAKKRHVKHAATKKRAKRAKRPAKAQAVPPASSAPTTQGTPICEDGSPPVQLARGSYICDDESEPACENGAEPKLSSSDGSLICPALAKGEQGKEGSGYGVPICEDESSPISVLGGSYACDDGSEPECEDGSEPLLSSSGLLSCGAPPEETETYESDG